MLERIAATVQPLQQRPDRDRAAVIVTQPLTKDEDWIAFEPDELKVFVDGLPQ